MYIASPLVIIPSVIFNKQDRQGMFWTHLNLLDTVLLSFLLAV